LQSDCSSPSHPQTHARTSEAGRPSQRNRRRRSVH